MKKFKDETCPQCGNYVRGQFIISSEREMMTKGGKMAVITGVNMVLPGAGTALNAVFGKHIDNLAENVADELDASEDFAFECPKCGNSWISSGRPEMPESMIQPIRNLYIEGLRSRRPYTSAWILGAITLYCIICIIVGIANDDMVAFVLGFFITIPFLIPTAIKINKISSLNKEIQACEFMSLRDFKNAHPELFTQYPQYR